MTAPGAKPLPSEPTDDQADMFRTLAEHSHNVIAIKDCAGRYQYVNLHYTRLFHQPLSDFIGRTDAELFPAETAAQFRANDLLAQEANTTLTMEEQVLVDGQWRHFLSVKFPLHDRTGALQGTGLIATDITARKAAEQRLWASEERFRLAFEQATVGMAMLATDGSILRINPHGGRLLGYMPETLEGKSILEITHPQDRASTSALMHGLLQGKRADTAVTKRYLHRKGHTLHCRLAISLVRDSEGHPLYFIGYFNDVTETLRIEAELIRLATTDPLTGVANRRPFFERMQQELARLRRHGTPACCLMLDFDHFKLINDRWGHSTGDAVLQHFCQRCQLRLRATDLLGRLGGEEFAILMPDTSLEGARTAAEQLRQWLASEPLHHEGQLISFSVSIGLTDLRVEDSSPDQVLARTDRALYLAKEQGRNRVETA